MSARTQVSYLSPSLAPSSATQQPRKLHRSHHDTGGNVLPPIKKTSKIPSGSGYQTAEPTYTTGYSAYAQAGYGNALGGELGGGSGRGTGYGRLQGALAQAKENRKAKARENGRRTTVGSGGQYVDEDGVAHDSECESRQPCGEKVRGAGRGWLTHPISSRHFFLSRHPVPICPSAATAPAAVPAHLERQRGPERRRLGLVFIRIRQLGRLGVPVLAVHVSVHPPHHRLDSPRSPPLPGQAWPDRVGHPVVPLTDPAPDQPRLRRPGRVLAVGPARARTAPVERRVRLLARHGPPLVDALGREQALGRARGAGPAALHHVVVPAPRAGLPPLHLWRTGGRAPAPAPPAVFIRCELGW